MTRNDLTALVRTIAEAAARCVGAEPRHTNGHVGVHGPWWTTRRQAVALAARAGDWRAKGRAEGPTVAAENPAINAAAVLALRERLAAQRDERARLLAADEAALRAVDEGARIYDAATVAAAVREGGGDDDLARWVERTITERVGGSGPWTRAEVRDATADACDAILRRRAMGGAP